VVESILVLSEEPAIFLDELHAEVAIMIVPAKARLKIIFFIVFYCYLYSLTTMLPFGFIFLIQKVINIL